MINNHLNKSQHCREVQNIRLRKPSVERVSREYHSTGKTSCELLGNPGL